MHLHDHIYAWKKVLLHITNKMLLTHNHTILDTVSSSLIRYLALQHWVWKSLGCFDGNRVVIVTELLLNMGLNRYLYTPLQFICFLCSSDSLWSQWKEERKEQELSSHYITEEKKNSCCNT